MKLDIGCGLHKRPDYYGIDRIPLPGINLVSDLNEVLPFPDHSVTSIAVCRMLPYVNHLPFTLGELYRISRHGAVLTFLCPYAHHFRHSANPFFNHFFDEYTPRYMTANFMQPANGLHCPPIAPYDYVPELPYDYRLLQMELFYKPAFSPPLYELDELELLKELQANVVDEILYRFVVVKDHLDIRVWEELCQAEYDEPLAVQQLRNRKWDDIS
ncbi:class I SAM-dependent methyltransferase [Paenibacillus rhizovicinus]|uniref:Class I SAM-dependent methyltransferase n=1 Tax=Paenibacillus rhizovicinus TaxID=2704463 RepID=A0A6C0P7X5_9BACL|nr:class I SAM-dependent methyltransferase [Paenibacillus rhizovicinus]QHW34648.1 class I SAM-dependent methyltransferase [Paenibacillus rhizovicinus]